MKRYIEGVSRDQGALFPDHLDDWIDDENVVRVIDAFVETLDLLDLGFDHAEATGRPGYHPSVLLKLYIYGYLNRVQSSRRLERETLRNVEVIVAVGAAFAGSQDDRRLQEGQWPGDPEGLYSVRRTVSSDRSACRGQRGDRRLEVQSGQQP
jgi:hypothetical protein